MAPPTATSTHAAPAPAPADPPPVDAGKLTLSAYNAAEFKSTAAPANVKQLVNDLGERVLQITLPSGGNKPDRSGALPESTKARFARHGIDLSGGYPVYPTDAPVFLDEGLAVRGQHWPHVERAKYADPDKKALLSAATEVRHLTTYIGTELVGIQIADLTDQQRDELALLVAERVVVFFRDQNLAPQKQLELGKYWGQVEVHPKVPHVPGVEGTTVIWPKLASLESKTQFGFKTQFGTSLWHTDLTHELQPASYTHLHNDSIPDTGGDTYWVSGYGVYDKLSPALQRFLDGKTAIYRSAHPYVDGKDPLSGPKYIEREHALIRTNPATGWKAVFVNRHYTTRIVGLEPAESDAILNLLFHIYENSKDLQVRFNWKPTKPGLGTSAIWDNRVSIHANVADYPVDKDPRPDPAHLARHGTRVTTLGETPFLDPASKSQRQTLGQPLY